MLFPAPNDYAETCKSRAYIGGSITEYASDRFGEDRPARLGIVPFSTPANLASRGGERPGLGNELVWKLHSEILKLGKFPVVEVLNRADWPGKKEEFNTGNHGAIAAARAAGYDLVMVGYAEQRFSPLELAAEIKVIDTSNNITVYSGEFQSFTDRTEAGEAEVYYWMDSRKPSKLFGAELGDKLAVCMARGLVAGDGVGEGFSSFKPR